MDVFFILKLAVMVALAIAFSLSIALILQRAKNRSESREILSSVDALSSVETPVDDSISAVAALPVAESESCETEALMEQNQPDSYQVIESLDSVDSYSLHDTPDSERHSMSKPEMLRQPQSFSDKPFKPGVSEQSAPASNDFLQTLLSIGTESELYRQSSGLLTRAEQQILRDLRSAGGKAAEVFCKVPVLDVLSPKEGHDFRASREVINILSTQYFSFVVCLQGSLDVVGVVESFDRHSKLMDMHKGRLRVLKTITRKAGVPMTILDTAGGYSSGQLKHQVGSLITHAQNPSDIRTDSLDYAFLTKAHAVKKNIANKPKPPSVAASSSCPSCGDGMVYRVSRSGKYKGQIFHTCQSYPKCRHIVREPTAAHSDRWVSGIQQKQPV